MIELEKSPACGLSEGAFDDVLGELVRARRRAGELAAALWAHPFDPGTLCLLQEFVAEAEEAAAGFAVLRSRPDLVRRRLDDVVQAAS